MVDAPRVVFLANDAVFSAGLAFLESFRATNPDLQLSMVPFADDVQKLEKLRDIYNFDILQVDTARWDALGNEFFPGAPKKFLHRLRKLALFDVDGPATIYLDLDMVVLSDLKFLVDPLTSGKADFICTATGNDPWVYKPIYKDYDKLKNARRFSDGFFAFNPKKLNADLAYQTIVDNKADYLAVRADQVYCQPVTNFIVDMLGLNVGVVFDMFRDISPQVWYGSPLLQYVDGQVVADDGKKVLFVHWAGPVDMRKEFRLRELFETYLTRAHEKVAGLGL